MLTITAILAVLWGIASTAWLVFQVFELLHVCTRPAPAPAPIEEDAEYLKFAAEQEAISVSRMNPYPPDSAEFWEFEAGMAEARGDNEEGQPC